MELRTFVKTALLDIVGAIQDAQKVTPPGTIVPETNTTAEFVNAGVTPMQSIEFEVSVRAEGTKGSEARLGVVNSLIGTGIAGKSTKEEGSASVIRFRGPVCLPVSDLPKRVG